MRRYRNSLCKFYWYHWDTSDQYILFNKASGQTHYLSKFAVDLLDLLRIEWLGFPELFERLSSLYDDFEPDIEIKGYLQETLEDLESFGLIDSQPA